MTARNENRLQRNRRHLRACLGKEVTLISFSSVEIYRGRINYGHYEDDDFKEHAPNGTDNGEYRFSRDKFEPGELSGFRLQIRGRMEFEDIRSENPIIYLGGRR